MCCCTPLEWRRLGELIGRASLPALRRPDPVHGLVAMAAVELGAAIAASSDPGGIRAHLAEIPGGAAVEILPV